MSGQTSKKPDYYFDLRLRDKFLAEGKITKSEIDAYFAALEDDDDKFIPLDSGAAKNKTSSEKSEESE